MVAIKAVNVLCTMTEASGTFMQRRVIKDVVPTMITFLNKQAEVSIKTGPLYSQSQSFKLQLTVLRSLGFLCRQLDISDTNLSPAVWVCSQYLSCRQPIELQQVSNKLYPLNLTGWVAIACYSSLSQEATFTRYRSS